MFSLPFLLPKARSAGELHSYHLVLWLEGKKILTSEGLAKYSSGSEFLGGSFVMFAVYFQLGISNSNVVRHCHTFAAKSNASTNLHMWFMDHSYGRLDPFQMPHTSAFSSQGK